MLMLCNLWTCLVFLTVFELIKLTLQVNCRTSLTLNFSLTLQVLVPEFQECWWDLIVLD